MDINGDEDRATGRRAIFPPWRNPSFCWIVYVVPVSMLKNDIRCLCPVTHNLSSIIVPHKQTRPGIKGEKLFGAMGWYGRREMVFAT